MKMKIRSRVSGLLITGIFLSVVLLAVFGCVDDKMEPEERIYFEKVKKSLENNATAREKDRLFIEAAAKGYTTVVELLLENGIDVNAEQNSGDTVLFYDIRNNHKDIVELLIENGADKFKKYYDGASYREDTLLHLAVRGGNIEGAKLLIVNGIEVDIKNKIGETPLNLAVQCSRKKIVELLIENGADINIKDDKDKSPLHYAVDKKNKEITQLLINKNDKRDVLLSWDPLHKAVWAGDKEMARKLLRKGAGVNAKDEINFTPLNYAILKNNKEITEILVQYGANINDEFIAAVKSEDVERIKRLIELGADVNVRYSFDYFNRKYRNANVLFQAVLDQNLEIINILIEAGADVNARDANNETPLFCVANQWVDEMIDMLCKAGADVNVQDKYGNTALIYAASILQIDIIKSLIQKGADVNIRNKQGKTALDYFFSEYLINVGSMAGAEVNTDLDTLKIFIREGAKADMHSEGAQAYFVEAAINGEKEIVQFFIKQGIDVNKKFSTFWHTPTALMEASYKGQIEIVKMLIEAGADTNLEDRYGEKAIDYAREKGYDEIVALLEHAGSK